MGWKTLKNHFNIKHNIQVNQCFIHIGSDYVQNLASIHLETGEIIINETFPSFLRKEYPELFSAKPEAILELIQAEDTFTRSIPVYTYTDDNIIEKYCEEVGFPNTTHDGVLMYNNMFSTDKDKVVKWAKRNLEAEIYILEENIQEKEESLKKYKSMLFERKAFQDKLQAEYPNS